MWRVRQEVDDQEHPARLQPCDEPLRREVRVVKVVEAQPDDREVEAGELAVAEGFRVRVLGHTEVSVERDHLVFGKALAMAVSKWFLDIARADSQRRSWESDKSPYLVASPCIVHAHHLLRKVNAHTLRRVWRESLSHRNWLAHGLPRMSETNRNNHATT